MNYETMVADNQQAAPAGYDYEQATQARITPDVDAVLDLISLVK